MNPPARFAQKHPERCPMVRVTWEDIRDFDEWNSDTQPWNAATIVDVGFLASITAERLLLVNSWSIDEHRWSACRRIPTGCIKTITLLARERTETNWKNL